MKLDILQESKRRTGRTSRMFQEVDKLIAEGKKVCLVTRTHCFRQDCKIYTEVPSDFDWIEMKHRGQEDNTVWVIDHHVIERDLRFRAMYESLVQFDKGEFNGN